MQPTNHVRTVRRAQNLTQRDLASRCGLTHSAVSQIEGGQRAGLRVTRLAIAGALDTPAAELFPL